MSVIWTTEQVLGLAADANIVRSARALAGATRWQLLARNEQAIWGKYPIPKRDPFNVSVQLAPLAFFCNCRNHKFPCNHILALLLLFLEQHAVFASEGAPDWVEAWQKTLVTRKAKRSPSTRGEQKRHALVLRGLHELELALHDIVRNGFATLPQKQKLTFWGKLADRLVDAQAGELARWVRGLARVVGEGRDWPERLLREIGRIQLLIRAFDSFDTLSPAQQADLRTAIGWLPHPSDADEMVRDKWLIIGRTQHTVRKRTIQRTWLYGTNRPALLTTIVHGKRNLDHSLVVGTQIDATLRFFQSQTPLNATIEGLHTTVQPTAVVSGSSSIGDSSADFAEKLVENVWLRSVPLMLHDVAVQSDPWRIVDQAGHTMPLPPDYQYGWHLLAMGRVTVAGVWDGNHFAPLSVWQAEQLLPLHVLRVVKARSPQLSVVSLEATLRYSRQPENNEWGELTRVAVTGTQHTPVPTVGRSSDLARIFDAIPSDSREYSLLIRAGTIDLYQQIGRNPAQLATSPIIPNGAQEQICSPRAQQFLGTMLDGRYLDLLPEFLTALQQAGQTVPPPYLPNLLAQGVRNASSRAHIIPVLGETGRWLAGNRADWAYAASAIDTWDGASRLWKQCTPIQRQGFMRQMRLLDPEMARELVRTTWKADTHNVRTWLLRLFEHNLSMQDEAFLELALDDRSSAIRKKSADLLTRLPQSRLAQRRINYVRPVVLWHKGKIRLRFPQTISPAMMRDGLVAPKDNKNSRQRGLLLQKLIVGVPLDSWADRWQTTPTAILRALPSSKWPKTLALAFSIAAEQQKNQAWARALVEEVDLKYSARVVKVLDAPTRAALFTRYSDQYANRALEKDSDLLCLFGSIPDKWSPVMVACWLRHFAFHVSRPPTVHRPIPAIVSTLRKFSKQCPSDSIDIALDQLRQLRPHESWQPKIRNAINVLQFRRDMLNAIDTIAK